MSILGLRNHLAHFFMVGVLGFVLEIQKRVIVTVLIIDWFHCSRQILEILVGLSNKQGRLSAFRALKILD